MKNNIPFSVVLAAGGIGNRMGTPIPKQYLTLNDKPIALYSFEVFLSMPEVTEIVIVCDPAYRTLFTPYSTQCKISFALPGKLRQDSIFNGIQNISGDPLICVHDAARPLIDAAIVRNVIQNAEEWQAAVLGVRAKATIKVCNDNQMISYTPDRSTLWEMQTPQVVRLSLLKEGYQAAKIGNKAVTDDVSLVELIGKPVKVVEGNYSNIKITTPDDLILLDALWNKTKPSHV